MSAPASGFFVTGGTLRHDAPSYVERRADRDLFDGLTRGAFCYVLTSRQMGKSSLMVRTAAKLREQGAQVVVLDLTAVGQNLTAEQWYDGMILRMAGQLRLEDELEDFWAAHARLSPVQRFFQALRAVVLPRCNGPLVVFVDEIDMVRSLSFPTDEFFAAIRELYNRRTEQEAIQRVTFCLLGVAAPSDLIRDTRMTPFNIGRRIELNDFTPEEAAVLARGLINQERSARRAAALLQRVLHWTSGHPYLTQRFCQTLTARPEVRDETGVDAVCEELYLSRRARDQDDNLLFVRDRMLRNEADRASLLHLYEQALRRRGAEDDNTQTLTNLLRLSGIVRSVEGRLVSRNRIYAHVFDGRWIAQNMPDAELRRQRAAFQRGVIRTTAIAAVVVAALALAAVFAFQQASRARRALAQSNHSQAQTRRVSGVAGQRFESLDALRRARAGFADLAALRDEAIACLALVDLKVHLMRTNFPPDTTALALSPGLGHYAVAAADGSIVVRQTENDREEARVPTTGLPVAWVALSPDARFLAAQYSGGERHRFVLWRLVNTALARAFVESPNQVRPGTLDFSADGRFLVVARQPAKLEIISLLDGSTVKRRSLRQATDAPREAHCVRFDALGLRVADAGPGSQQAQLWNLSDGSVTNRHFPREISALAWSPDGNYLAAGGNAGLVLSDLYMGRSRPLTPSQSDATLDLAFSPDGTRIASLEANRILRLWCPATGRHVTEALPGPAKGRLFFSTNGRRLGLAGPGTGVRIWQIDGGEEYRVFRAAPEIYAPIHSIDFDPEGRMLVAVSDMGGFCWDTATGRSLTPLAMQSIRSLRVHPVTGDLFGSGPKGMFQLARVARSGTDGVQYAFGSPQTLELPGGLELCSLPREGKQVVVAHGRHVHALPFDESSHGGLLPIWGDWKALALSPNGRWLATWSESLGEVHVRDMRNPDEQEKKIQAGRNFAFTPDSRFLLTVSGGSNRLWNTEVWTASPVGLPPYREGNAPVAFGRHTGGRRLLAIADEPGLIRLQELSTAADGAPTFYPLARLEDPDRKRVTMLTFNPQGNRLAAATTAQTVQVWDLNRVERGLALLGLSTTLPPAAEVAPQALTLTFEPGPVNESRSDDWTRIETRTLTLGDPATTNSFVRAKLLKERGTIYLRLDRPSLARADLAEALRLMPGEEAIVNLLKSAEERLKPESQP